MDLTLLVIRSAVPEDLSQFYSLLGLSFEYHRHGNGPYHYSGHMGATLLEIYPLAKDQMKADTSLRIGIALETFNATIQQLQLRATLFAQAPATTKWGFMAIVIDPEGRKIELYQK